MLLSYDTKGSKESFAKWISNITPYDTPFISMTGKHPVANTVFDWQTDTLDAPDTSNAFQDDRGDIPDPILAPTTVVNNVTQIFRKVVEVSDTVEAIDAYGYESPLEYQIAKASKELKVDMEAAFLSDQKLDDGNGTNRRVTSGFYDLTASVNEVEPTTGAITHKRKSTYDLTLDDVFDITYNLWLVGSRANTIMFHPSWANSFAGFMETSGDGRQRQFRGEKEAEVAIYVNHLVDPLGQRYELVPNDNMPVDYIYFYHPHDWFQRVLRAPAKTHLDKTGATDKVMLETEIGLQHRNRFASGILEMTYVPPDYHFSLLPPTNAIWEHGQPFQLDYESLNGNPQQIEWLSSDNSIAKIENGKIVPVSSGDVTITANATYYRGIIKSDDQVITLVNTEPATIQLEASINKTETVDISDFFSVSPAEADAMGYTFESLRPQYATVDANGIVTGVLETGTDLDHQGLIKITSVADPELFWNVIITVNLVPHTLTINGQSASGFRLNGKEGQTFSITIVADAPGGVITTPVSSNTAVATVENFTKVDDTSWVFEIKTTRAGSITVSLDATFPNGVSKAVIAVSSTSYNFSLSPGSLPTAVASSWFSLAPKSNDLTVDPLDVEWTSSNPAVAKVYNDGANKGHISYLKQGQASISAKWSVPGTTIVKTASAQAIVSSLSVNWRSASETPSDTIVGKTQKYFLQSNQQEAGVDKTIVWESSDPTVASISDVGLLTALKEGTTTISATVTATNSYGDSATASPPPKTINIVKPSATFTGGIFSMTLGQGASGVLKAFFKASPASITTNDISITIVDPDPTTGYVTINPSTDTFSVANITPNKVTPAAGYKLKIYVNGEDTGNTMTVIVNTVHNFTVTSNLVTPNVTHMGDFITFTVSADTSWVRLTIHSADPRLGFNNSQYSGSTTNGIYSQRFTWMSGVSAVSTTPSPTEADLPISGSVTFTAIFSDGKTVVYDYPLTLAKIV